MALFGQGFYHAFSVFADGTVNYQMPPFDARSIAIYNHSDQRITAIDEGQRYPIHVDPGTVYAQPLPPSPQWNIQAAAKMQTGFAYGDFTDDIRAYIYGLQGAAHNKTTFALTDTTIKSFTLPRLSHQLIFEFSSILSGGTTVDLFQVTYQPPGITQTIVLVTRMVIIPSSFPQPVKIDMDFAPGTIINVNLQVAAFNVTVTMGF